MAENESKSTLGRRTFIGVSSAIGAMAASGVGPAIAQSRSSRPVVISSGNGFVYKNGGTETCVERAYRMITDGTDVLESLIAGVNIVELDPDDASVGFGGLPDAEGRVTLDSCCMHGPLKRAGGVAALQGVRTPANVAKAVADLSDHHLFLYHYFFESFGQLASWVLTGFLFHVQLVLPFPAKLVLFLFLLIFPHYLQDHQSSYCMNLQDYQSPLLHYLNKSFHFF